MTKSTLTPYCIVVSTLLLLFIPWCHAQTLTPTPKPTNPPRAQPEDGVPDHQQRPLPFVKATAAPTNATVVTPTVAPTVAPTVKAIKKKNNVRAPGHTTKPRGPTPPPIPEPTSVPTRAPCFSEISTVQSKDRGVTAMKDIKLGDMVLNAQGKYDTIYSFAHYSPDVKAEFIQIHAAGLQAPLEISPEHMLFVQGGKAIPAGAVSVGEKISLMNDGEVLAQVTKIRKVIRKGMYAPYTKSGTIAVNGVAASCYIDLHHRLYNSTGVVYFGQYKTPLSVHFTRHVREAPHRLICHFAHRHFCQTETYTEEGYSAWVATLNALTKWSAKKQNAVIMGLIFVPLFIVTLMFYAIESMLLLMTSNNSSYCQPMLLLLMIAIASLYMLAIVPFNKKKKHAKKQV